MSYISLSRETTDFMEQYARTTGQSLEEAVHAALNEWFDILGEPVLLCPTHPSSSLTRKAKPQAKLLAVPKAPKSSSVKKGGVLLKEAC